jgi:hypothetical protein
MVTPENQQRCKDRIGDCGEALVKVFQAMTAARSEEDIKSVLSAMDACCEAMQEATFALECAAGYKRNPVLSTCASCGLPRVTKVAA